MSFKAIILLTRAEGATHEQFANWWLKQHAPLAKQLPNLRKGVFNLVENPAEGDPDGVSELWFDTQADFEAAYASELASRSLPIRCQTFPVVVACSWWKTPFTRKSI